MISRRWAGPALLVAAVGFLWWGHFVQLDDTSGFGYDRWVPPLLLPALAAAMTGLVVAARDAASLQRYGGTLGLLLAWTVWECATDPGFRFIWASGEDELFLFQVFLGLLAFALVAVPVAPADGGAGIGHRDGALRLLGYVLGTLVAVALAFAVGTEHYDATHCVDSQGDCDLGPVEGLVWAFFTLCGSVVAAAVNEVRLAVRRPRRARERGRR